MAARRFDTDTLLKQLLKHDGDAFKAFYERYRGRVYRFIVRQCGNGEEGQAAYMYVWAHLIEARLKSKDSKSLKRAFLTGLQRPTFKPLVKTSMVIPITLMPKDLEEGGVWSTLLVEMVRRLPEGLRKRFLFRYEIGLSHKAIATIFHEKTRATKGYVEEAEHELLEGLMNTGYKKKHSLNSLYRETRLLTAPGTWDQELLKAYPDWLKNGVPEALLKPYEGSELPNSMASAKTFIKKAVNQLRSDISARIQSSDHSAP